MIRKAVANDLPQIMKCINDAKAFLKASGSSQWNGADNYPDDNTLLNDINMGISYVCVCDNVICGVAAFAGIEKEYENIVSGEWLNKTENYLTIHRLAVNSDYRGKGIAKEILEFSFNYARSNRIASVRIDTHPVNKIMQSLCLRVGFTDCGIVKYSRIIFEPERIIYEKIV